jgi:hypothetical protein
MMEVYHFAKIENGVPVMRGGMSIVIGKKYNINNIEMCQRGFHGSIKPLDALHYAPGNYISIRELSGEIIIGDDKVVASECVHIAGFNGEEMLRKFARLCALDVIHLWDAAWDAARAAVGDAVWVAARDAVWDAAWDAARAAAWDAARAAVGDAVWAAARDAVWDAAWDAARDAVGDAVWAAVGDAARDAVWDAAWDAARYAAWAAVRLKQNARLKRMINYRIKKGMK